MKSRRGDFPFLKIAMFPPGVAPATAPVPSSSLQQLPISGRTARHSDPVRNEVARDRTGPPCLARCRGLVGAGWEVRPRGGESDAESDGRARLRPESALGIQMPEEV